MSDPLFTVFTPTYNRGHTLERVFESLSSQTCREFEWLVVDDGSTDDTRDRLRAWSDRADFPIRVLVQRNRGKHVAFNRALSEARAPFFTPLDSDDRCVAQALERFKFHWQSIPEAERDTFSGVCVLCRDQHGQVIGDSFPADPLDTDSLQLAYVLKISGEKWGFHRTDVLRRHPFPELPGPYVPENELWNSVARTHRMRCVNEALRIYYRDDPVTGETLTGPLKAQAVPPGKVHYYGWLLDNDLDFFLHSPLFFLKAAVQYATLSQLSGHSCQRQWTSLRTGAAKCLWLGALLPSYGWAVLRWVKGRLRRL